MKGIIKVGEIRTFVSRPGEPLDPEQWAEIITNNIISIGETAQEPLRAMTLDLREGIKKLLTHYVGEIRKEQLAYVSLKKD